MTNKSSAPNPTFTSVKGNKLVDTGKHWSIETESGKQFDTGRKKLRDAKGVLSGFEKLETAVEGGATLTDQPLVDMGRNWGTTLSDDTQVNLGQILQGGLAALVGWLFKTVNDMQQEVATLKAQVIAYRDSIAGFNQNLLVIEEVIREILFKVGG